MTAVAPPGTLSLPQLEITMAFSSSRTRISGLALAAACVAGVVQSPAALAQGSNAAASSVGRPAIAGAQGGLGVQAGPPQGGLGVQGNEGAQVRLDVRPRREQANEPFPQGRPSLAAEARAETAAKGTPDPSGDVDVTAKEKRDTAKRVSRTAKGQVPVTR